MIAFDIAIVLYLNFKKSDLAILTDIKQIQSGLDAYLVKNAEYPVVIETVALNDVYASTQKLCFEGFRKANEKCSREILNPIPNSRINSGGRYKYQSPDGKNYKIEFFLKTNFKALNISKGKNCATNSQILSQPCF